MTGRGNRLMTDHDLFEHFKVYCRRAGLGRGGASSVFSTGSYTAFVGSWFYVADWAFEASGMADAVRSVVEETERCRLPAIWRVYDGDVPEGLTEALSCAGFAAAEETYLLAFDLAHAIPAPGFESREVRTEADLDVFLQITSSAFGDELVLSPERRAKLLASGEVRSFVSQDESGPLSAGQFNLMPGNPVILLRGGSTMPGQRGKGGYVSLVATRLLAARGMGKQVAFVEAGPMSRPILTGIGFKAVRRATSWTYRRNPTQ